MLQIKEAEKSASQANVLFADFDPDPVISISPEGSVIHANDSSSVLYSSENLKERKLTEIINFPFDIREYIQNDRSAQFSVRINQNHYSVFFQGVSYFQMAQIYMHDITETKRNEEKLLEVERRQKELTDGMRERIEQERQKLAGQIYDEVSQNLSLVRLKLYKLNLIRNSKVDSEEYLNTISLLEATINVLKGISYKLKPKILDEMGLGPAVKDLCNEVSRSSGIKCSVNVIESGQAMDKKCATYLFRIIQEALDNVVIHSRATEFSVQLVDNEKCTRVFLSDNGIGFEPDKLDCEGSTRCLGLLSIKERTEALNGKLKIDSFLHKGTVIIVEVPKKAGLLHA
ncbi:MAG TPA: ATP-binding protein [Ignavibacteriales bacterium]|nr:ATP-binding protein [Ignavibacteriales bacterium]